MGNIIKASIKGTNTAVIALSGTGYINLDTTPLTALGLWGAGLYYNSLELYNNHTAAINVRVGNDEVYIAAGDGYAWDIFNQVFFTRIIITELGGAAQIDIDDIKYVARRLK